MGGAKYFVTLMDEYSGISKVRFLNQKSGAGDAISKMIAELETLLKEKTGQVLLIQRSLVKFISSDGGGEYTAN